MHRFLKDLNEQQRQSVTANEGPVAVIAGAGSGKTRVITYRVAYLIGARDVPPRNILAVTFTNKAAEEMRTRIYRILGTAELESWIGTFHATCAQLLRREANRLGYKHNFVIYDESDQLMLVKHCMKKLNLPERDFSPNAMLSRISLAKGEMLSPELFESAATSYIDENAARIYKQYQRSLFENNAMDFDDLLNNALAVLREHSDCLQKYRSIFKYILVDEFQDTNRVQYELVRELAGEHRNLYVVGDDDQSIYSWRGAEIGNLLDFGKDFPETKTFFLEENYRSTQLILDAANAVIENNPVRNPKRLWTQNERGEKIVWYCASDERGEARYIAEELMAIRGRHPELQASDFAVFYRTNAQSRVIEDEFRNAGIPYTIVGGLRFYDRKEIKDILAYLKVITNPADAISLKRIINTPPRGIGKSTLEKVEEFASKEGIFLLDAIGRASEVAALRPAARESLREFYEYISQLRQKKDHLAAVEIIREVVETSRYLDMLKQDKTFQAQARMENIDELLSASAELGDRMMDYSLDTFLQDASLHTDIDDWDDERNLATLMTLHMAKGLEFPIVFIAGMEEDLFPHANTLKSDKGLEEERRLCYVGITRAKRRVIFTSADTRRIKGISSVHASSRFMTEIPSDLMDVIGSAQDYETEYEEHHQKMPDYDDSRLNVGDMVHHSAFGAGKIAAMTGSGDKTKIAVHFFRDNRQRNLLLKYAGLRKK